MNCYGDRGSPSPELSMDELAALYPSSWLWSLVVSISDKVLPRLLTMLLGGKHNFNRAQHDWGVRFISAAPTAPHFSKGVLTTDLKYPSEVDGFLNRARLYIPALKTRQQKIPVVVYYHGGGWVLGSGAIVSYDWWLRKLCKRLSCYVLSVDYRMAPEHPFPTPTEDCYSVLPWMACAEAATVLPDDLDRQRVVLMGDSAGGNLTSVVALMSRDRQLDRERGVRVVHQVPICPCFMMRPLLPSRIDRHNITGLLPRWLMLWFEQMYVPDGRTVDELSREPYVNPLRAPSLTGLPPLTGILAGADILRDEGVLYFKAVQNAGVDVDWRQWDAGGHVFLIALPWTKRAVNALEYILARLAPLMDNVSERTVSSRL